MSSPRWRAALRLARRDAWRHKGRSLLVIALIGLPVLALGGADIAYRTWQLSPAEKLTRTIGAAAAGIQWVGEDVEQTPAGFVSDNGWSGGGREDPAAQPSTNVLRAHLPGSRIIEQRRGQPVEVRVGKGIEDAALTGLDIGDPVARGLVRTESGRAPRTGAEAAITPALAAATGLGVGDALHLVDPARRLRIVAVVADPGYRDAQTVYVLPSAVPVHVSRFGDPGVVTWLVDSPGPVTWRQVLALNELGYVVVSRQAYLHPPPNSRWTFHPENRPISGHAIAVGTLLVGMALLEIVLLAGPAFAVGARRQRRDLGLLASVGGRRADLRNVVLAGGVVLGLAAGLVGAGLAIVVAAIGIPTLGARVDQVPGHFDVRPLELGALMLVAMVTAILAAAFPAYAAARADVVAALAGRRGAVRTRKRVVALGVALGAVGVVIALGGATKTVGASVVLAGVALIEFGLIICTPGLLGLAGRLGRRLPLPARIALRDASRNRSAATPAVAAVMASVIGATAIMLAVASSNDQNRREYQPMLPMGDAYVYLPLRDGASDAGAVAAALRATLPSRRVVALSSPPDGCVASTSRGCSYQVVSVDPGRAESVVGYSGTVTRYRGGALPETVIDDGSAVTALFDRPEPAAVAALRAGKVIVPDRASLHDGAVRLDITTVTVGNDQQAPAPGDQNDPVRSVLVPAVAVETGIASTSLIVPPALAARLGVVSRPTGVLADDVRVPSDAQLQRARGTLAAIAPDLGLHVESGYHDDRAWMLYGLVGVAALVAIGAAVIATALANVDGRADLVALGAVGAAPRTRRVLSLSRAGMIAGIGTVLGTAAGFVPAVAWIRGERGLASYRGFASYSSAGAPVQLRLVVPWPPVLALLVGIPLLAALVAGAFSRSRLPSERAPE